MGAGKQIIQPLNPPCYNEPIMKKEITNEDLLHKMDERFEQIDKRFEKMDKRFEKMDERFDELTLFTKMGFDDLGQKITENTESIAQLKESTDQTNDHLCRVELTMIQEFAASNLQRNRLTTQLGRHAKKIKKLETKRR